MRITRKRLGLAVGAAVVVGGSIWYFARPEVLAVDTALVGRRPIESVIEAKGRTRVRQRFMLVAPVAGRVDRIALPEGAAVRAGDVVARVLPAPIDSEARLAARARIDAAAAAVVTARGQVRLAAATLEQRRREHARAATLVAAGAMAPRALEEARLALTDAEQQARAATEQSVAAEADLRQVRAVLDARAAGPRMAVPVRAPATGRVLRVPERSERIVAAGTPLVEIGDPASLEIVADLLSTDVLDVAVGDRVRFPGLADARDGEEAPSPAGAVRSIEPSGFTKVSALGIEEQRVNVIVDIMNAPAALADGHGVTVAIVTWSSPSSLAVPRNAIVPGDAGTWTAFVVRRGVVEKRRVRLGHLGGVDAEVIGGLNPGDEVVVFPSDRLRDGVRVSARKPEA